MERFVVGAERDQTTLFPPYLEDRIAEDNPVRVVDAFAASRGTQMQKRLRTEGREATNYTASSRALPASRPRRTMTSRSQRWAGSRS